MKLRRVMSAVLCAALTAGMVLHVDAAAVSYLPDVTAEMSVGTYWSQDNTLQMTWDEIQERNARIIGTPETNMRDLKNQAETVDGVKLNQSLKSSAEADAAYYLGWTYLGKDRLAKETDFRKMINNTQRRNPSHQEEVLYAVAVQRSALRTFPSFTPIWDDPKDPDFDYQYLVGIRVNEPLVITSVSRDGKFYLAKNVCCSGWIPVEDVAVCRDKEEWLSAWDLEPERALVVYGNKVYTEMSNSAPETSEQMLTMGTVLEMADVEDARTLIDNRAAYQSYVVWMPVRGEDGSYSKKLTLIPESERVSAGYLPLTSANVMMVAMQALGAAYGWGGSLHAEDCSAYVRNIYKCFGLELARNTTWQAAMPVARVNMSGMCREERIAAMNALPAGAVLFFSGHEMLYLGQRDGKYYVASSVSKIRDPLGGTGNARIRSVVINTLDITRATGVSWLDSLTSANVPYWGEEKSRDIPGKSWYHDGVRYMTSKGYMTAGSDGFFRTDDGITQAELVQILWAMSQKPAVEGVEQDTWYAQAAAWIESRGLLPLEGETSFAPEHVVTRAQLAVILYQIAENRGGGFEEGWEYDLGYADAVQLSVPVREAMSWLVKMNVISGTDDNRLDPGGDVTRAQLAVILKNFAALTDSEAAK